jgi:formylglycine-generating enzyme required for sulfatase activity
LLEKFWPPKSASQFLIEVGGISVGLAICILLSVWFAAQQFPVGTTSMPTLIAVATATRVLPTNTTVAIVQPTTIPIVKSTDTLTPNPTNTSSPTWTPTAKPTDTPRPTPMPTIGIGSSKNSLTDGATIVYVPAGNFLMGSSDVDKDAQADEKPQHTVYLDAFWIDKYEVTNTLYKKCVDASKCPPHIRTDSRLRDTYYGDPRFDNFPVIYVSWDDAKSYCAWASKHLPSEVEWEKAARGMDGRIYPWGNNFDQNRLNSALDGHGYDTMSVGIFPLGASPYGAMDMAGTVAEWVADWYSQDYYTYSPSNNPTGPSEGQQKVLRGGHWVDTQKETRVTYRYHWAPDLREIAYGFRCVQ